MIELHYAPLVLDGDIPCYKFKTTHDLIDFVRWRCLPIENVVFVLAIGDTVFVTESPYIILFKNIDLYPETPKEFHIQEYSSYEIAYGVALEMMELNPLCYLNATNI